MPTPQDLSFSDVYFLYLQSGVVFPTLINWRVCRVFYLDEQFCIQDFIFLLTCYQALSRLGYLHFAVNITEEQILNVLE
ncbi:MAG TPA: hypothetical protein VE956_14745 [Nodularia sp. (in: cyanobacteria)]|nr:hypothetical protein [Nodularia sp. (in: cyanobacteria)]